MLDEEWEGVLEEVVGSLFKWDSSGGVQEGFIPFLQLLGEGLVRVVCSRGHIQGYTERRA